ncbi:MAG: hypothetical protein R3B06_32175, partial [Kofleriaceae bacterium]
MSRLASAVVVATLVAACGSDLPTGSDGEPIYVERAAGALVVTVTVGDGPPQTGVLDVMSPLTVLDAPLGQAVERHGTYLGLLGRRSPTVTDQVVRARYSPNALFMHPCDTADPCTVGRPGTPTPITAVVGADTFTSDALRVSPGTDQVTIFPDIAGSNAARAAACEAVVASPFFGGGTLIIGGTEVTFSGLRPTLGVCLSPDPANPERTRRGTDATMVLSTGIGTSILGRSRYVAWQVATGGPAVESLPPATVLLPSGPIEGRLARIDALAIVGSSASPQGACRQVYASHVLADGACPAGSDCPCTNATVCAAVAVVELADEFEALVVADDEPLLQALRTEVRPDQPEIDGVLGLGALATTEFDLDYPNA